MAGLFMLQISIGHKLNPACDRSNRSRLDIRQNHVPTDLMHKFSVVLKILIPLYVVTKGTMGFCPGFAIVINRSSELLSFAL